MEATASTPSQEAGIPAGFGAIAPPPGDEQLRQSGPAPEVRLGDVVVPVYAQRHAYLANRLGRTFQAFVESGEQLATENFLSFLGGQTYEVLSALIPALGSRMPKHVFAGFGSPEAMDAGEYDPGQDRSPSFPEMVEAFECVWRVNRFDVVGKLGSIVDPTLLRAAVRAQMAERLSTTSQSSPPMSGGSDRTSSGTTAPTGSQSAV